SAVRMNVSIQSGDTINCFFGYGDLLDREIDYNGKLDQTKSFWSGWLDACSTGICQEYGEYTPIITRSLLTLKLLTFQPTGAIAAAATTSLPEVLGSVRNWDYRFTWLRDASFTLKAMFNMGHITEADSFIAWLHKTFRKYGSKNLQIMYSLQGESDIREQELSYLSGYRNSAPVRIGNEACRQNQWDIYGEIMDTALRISDYAGKIDDNLWSFFRDVVNCARKNWRKPDHGIWEVRNGPFHFVYSKVMCWVALDRGIIIARRYGFDAPLDEWEKERDNIKNDVLAQGYNPELKSFVQHYGCNGLDASLLLLPLVGFLSVTDERIQNTIAACREKLSKNGFLLRYTNADGLEGEGKEGAFLLCNFWLIECLIVSDRIEEAKKVFEHTQKAANHLGLFSEEYDPESRELLGNFPQAFTHIGCINAIVGLYKKNLKIQAHSSAPNFSERIKKLIPYSVVLNKRIGSVKEENPYIAVELKQAFNNLQGAFFDASRGRVDYIAMKKSKKYQHYLSLARQLAMFNPGKLKHDNDKKAFWINIYNILIIHGIIELDIRNSVREVTGYFSRIMYTINGMNFTPDTIEHGILRRNAYYPGSLKKQFSWLDTRKKYMVSQLDPRIHGALVCASSSCPPIAFYDAERIDEQLDTAMRSFLNRKGLVIDYEHSTINLSQVFKWYHKDFGPDQAAVLNFIKQYAPRKEQKFLENRLETATVSYLPYDWNLNRSL
ncbi:MAG: DUF547 domain-containing protein, partial [Elusimicrobia bacterium]|nr:DUF547 domain-containing protein [Elusimicrobiota bacterium]MBD3412771.1 DUF547 domain-containing protein [Elusimicrobiota bacterium]